MAYITEAIIGAKKNREQKALEVVEIISGIKIDNPNMANSSETGGEETLEGRVNKFSTKLNISYVNKEEGKKFISVERLKPVFDFASRKPHLGKASILLIDDADCLNGEGQNKLLKLIEEPPNYLKVILLLENEKNLLSTIRSRCVTSFVDNRSEGDLNLKKIAVSFLLSKPLSRTNAYLQLVDLLEKENNNMSKMNLLREFTIMISNNTAKLLHEQKDYSNLKELSKKGDKILKLTTKINKAIAANVNYKLITDQLFLELNQNSVE